MNRPLITRAEARNLATKHGDPLYVYRKNIITRRYRGLFDAIPYPKKRIFYACKANANLELLKHLKSLGSSIECVSPGEVERALAAGFTTKDISFTCSNISEDELVAVMQKGVSVHIDSLAQLEWWGQARPNSHVSLRINRGFGAGSTSHVVTGGPESKFGIYHTDLRQAKRIVHRHGLTVIGLQQHIGSNILRASIFIRAMRLLLDTAKEFPDLAYLDFGGGIGIAYRPTENPMEIVELGSSMSNIFQKFCNAYGRQMELRLEPGRYIVAECGALLVRVTDRKQTPHHTFIGVDSGFNHLIRPAMYGAYHHIFNLSNPRGMPQAVTVVGNVCESSDRFAVSRALPAPRIGDLLLLADAGAYGYTMSSDYNLRPRPKEIVL